MAVVKKNLIESARNDQLYDLMLTFWLIPDERFILDLRRTGVPGLGLWRGAHTMASFAEEVFSRPKSRTHV